MELTQPLSYGVIVKKKKSDKKSWRRKRASSSLNQLLKGLFSLDQDGLGLGAAAAGDDHDETHAGFGIRDERFDHTVIKIGVVDLDPWRRAKRHSMQALFRTEVLSLDHDLLAGFCFIRFYLGDPWSLTSVAHRVFADFVLIKALDRFRIIGSEPQSLDLCALVVALRFRFLGPPERNR